GDLDAALRANAGRTGGLQGAIAVWAGEVEDALGDCPAGLVRVAERPHRTGQAFGDAAAVVVADVERAVGGRVHEAGGGRVAADDSDDPVGGPGRRLRQRQATVVQPGVDAAKDESGAVEAAVQLPIAGGGGQVDRDRLVASPTHRVRVADRRLLNLGAAG